MVHNRWLGPPIMTDYYNFHPSLIMIPQQLLRWTNLGGWCGCNGCERIKMHQVSQNIIEKAEILCTDTFMSWRSLSSGL